MIYQIFSSHNITLHKKITLVIPWWGFSPVSGCQSWQTYANPSNCSVVSSCDSVYFLLIDISKQPRVIVFNANIESGSKLMLLLNLKMPILSKPLD